MSINKQVQAALAEEKAPEGTIIIKRGNDTKLYNIEDLAHMRELPIGQLFCAVARHYDKKPTDYGTQWIKYLTPQYEVSNQFTFMKNTLADLRNDLERFNLVCKHLGEPELMEVPADARS